MQVGNTKALALATDELLLRPAGCAFVGFQMIFCQVHLGDLGVDVVGEKLCVFPTESRTPR